MNEIWAIILAAGESKRMGSPKMILPFRGMTIIEKVIENVLSSDVDKTIIVLGAGKEKILKLTEKLPVMYCFNENYKNGMLTSVKRGFEYLPKDFRAAVVLLGDQPMIGASVINTVIKGYNESGKNIIIPVYNNKRGHPLLVDKRYWDEIISLDGPEGLKELINRHPDDLLEVETGNPEILTDIDTEEEYLNELNQIL
jgi:molybdenum cofactor cytidylyltransferase